MTITVVRTNSRKMPRWANRCAHAVPLLTLPSGLWRIALICGFSGWNIAGMELSEKFTIFALSIISECAALLTLGLVRPWGQTVPQWLPKIGGMRIPIWAVVIPASLGALAITCIWIFALFHLGGLANIEQAPTGVALWVMCACYAPLLAWGPLLAAVTVAYYLARRT
ncbi:MAG: hypothetical protein HOQ05_11815 [Corynebacteriales bacterium]|nr:hypothetical protein [Mycobacteriales bacterium]